MLSGLTAVHVAPGTIWRAALAAGTSRPRKAKERMLECCDQEQSMSHRVGNIENRVPGISLVIQEFRNNAVPLVKSCESAFVPAWNVAMLVVTSRAGDILEQDIFIAFDKVE